MLLVLGLKSRFDKETGFISLFISAIRGFNGPVSGYAINSFVDSAADRQLY